MISDMISNTEHSAPAGHRGCECVFDTSSLFRRFRQHRCWYVDLHSQVGHPRFPPVKHTPHPQVPFRLPSLLLHTPSTPLAPALALTLALARTHQHSSCDRALGARVTQRTAPSSPIEIQMIGYSDAQDQNAGNQDSLCFSISRTLFT
jgi:hypothetical protein